MSQSIFFRRILLLVFISLLLNALLTSTVYPLFAKQVFFELKSAELYKLGGRVQLLLFDSNLENNRRYQDSIREVSSLFDARIFKLGSNQQITPILNEPTAIDWNEPSDREIIDRLRPLIPKFTKTAVEATFHVGQGNLEYIVVSLPAYGEDDTFLGAVLLTRPASDLMGSSQSLTRSLLYSILLVLPFIILLSFIISFHLVRPLKQMQFAARAMASGDFSIRTHAHDRDEIGQLGMTLNYMANELSKTISELVVERNRLRQLIDGLGEGILSVDMDGSITHINPALRQLFAAKSLDDLSTDDPCGQSREEIVPLESLWSDFDQVLRDNCAIVRTLSFNQRILRVSISPLEDERGNIAGAVGLIRDATESERLEQTRRDYVANVSHELRTPLTGMRALIEPLRDNLVTDEENRHRYYSLIYNETLRLSRLIDDLLELSRLQSSSSALEKHIFPLEELLLDVGEKYTSLANEKGIEFQTQIPKLPNAISNPDRIEQVLVILLDNAFKFTPTGGKIDLRAEPILEEHCIRVIVRDNGKGIAPEDIDHVFERFYKADKAHSGGGTGLGLSIAKEIMRQMGERIAVECKDGYTEFGITVQLSTK